MLCSVLDRSVRSAIRAPLPPLSHRCRLPPVEVVAGQRRARYRTRAWSDPKHVAHSRAVSDVQTRLTDDSLLEASTEGWEGGAEGKRPELWLPRVRLHALMADRTGHHGHFAEYHARFHHDEETIQAARCVCGKPLTPTPCECPFLEGLVRPPLWGYTKALAG